MRYHPLHSFSILLCCVLYLISCTPPDTRTYRQIDNDAAITQTIYQHLQADPQLQSSRIHVHVVDAMVLLTGQTSHASLKFQAEKAVRSISSVTRLYNEITISEPPDLLQRKRDHRLTTRIRTQLLQLTGMRAVHFKVTTEYDVVYLIGILTPIQSRLAMDTIRRTPGVKKAVNVLREA
ncbi:MAG: BON domain-containing protein [Legionellales bacterium]|nr:BON domain-containing protein [Legionellales bacterium]